MRSLCIFILFISLVSGFSTNHTKADGRIVGGVNVDISAFGWLVSVQVSGEHFCGGSIVNENWVLIAAHCLENEYHPEESVIIRAGSSKHNTGGELYGITKVVPHPKYNFYTYDYDAALIRLAKPIRLNGNTIRAANLVKAATEVPDGALLTVTGWGALEEGGSASQQLQGVNIPKVNQQVCRESYNSLGEITDRMFCAGYLEGGKDTCQMDSGGPIVDESRILVGIVSWGAGCARPGKPGIYTTVAQNEIREFIREHTGV